MTPDLATALELALLWLVALPAAAEALRAHGQVRAREMRRQVWRRR